MSMSPPQLEDFRDELRTAIAADLEHHRLHRRQLRRTVALGGLGTVLAVVGISVALVIGGRSGVSPADAAILNSASIAVTPPSDSVMHVVASVTLGSQPAQPYELWATGNLSRAIKEGQEIAWNGSQMLTYDPSTNTISSLPNWGNHAPADLAATLRSLIASGKAQVTGTTVVAGVPAYVLTLSGVPDGQGVPNGTYEVAESDYRPLQIQGTNSCDNRGDQCTETVSFQTWEYLPATPTNLSLVDLVAQHPGAKVQSGIATGSSATSTSGSD